jgi:hypothetical protein
MCGDVDETPPAATGAGTEPEVLRQRLAFAAGFLRRAATRVRWTGYRQAEEDCFRLAAALRRRVGDETLSHAEFRAVPRGGLVVLGMLSYALDLRREQLEPSGDAAAPLVLVDDCALSGLRLRATMARLPARREVVVAHLYSHPDLRRAVEEREPRVSACVAAGDLADRSRDLHRGDEEHATWREQWLRRLGDDRYWLGLPELVAFAWSEPDRPFWNAATGRVEDGWRFVPPHRCLKNRARLAAGLQGFAPAAGAPPWRLPEDVVWGEFDGVLWLGRGPTDEVFSLAGTAAVAWKALAAGGSAGTAAAVLARSFAVEEDAARADVESLAGELVAAGLLERGDGPG